MWLTNGVKQSLLEGLEIEGFAIVDSFLSPDNLMSLQNRIEALRTNDQFEKARLGYTGALDNAVLSHIRGDFTSWIDPNTSDETETMIWDMLAELRHFLNETFFVGIQSVEAHYAIYPPGARYEKHIDQKEGTKSRRITFVLYLNPSSDQISPWHDDDGGELLFYSLNGQLLKRVLPSGNRLVLFKSDVFPHEVLPSTRWRKSLTGWFRNDFNG